MSMLASNWLSRLYVLLCNSVDKPADCGVWTHPHFYTDLRPCVSDIERDISALKFGRSAGLDCLTKEHIVYAVVCHIKTLFNAFVSHGFVPDVFGNGVTVPVPKDKCGDLHDVN